MNDFGAANTSHLVICDAQSGRLEYSTFIDRKWARILDVQMNNKWVLLQVMEDPGEIPSECFVIEKATNRLVKLLPNYSWGEKVPSDTTVFTSSTGLFFKVTMLTSSYRAKRWWSVALLPCFEVGPEERDSSDPRCINTYTITPD